MKKSFIVYIALVLFGIGASIFFPRMHEKWTDASTGSNLILSLKGTSPNMESTRLEIRCDGVKSEVRLYMPIGIRPAFGGASEGPAEMGLTEIFQNTDCEPVPLGDGYGNIWVVDASQDFATKQDPLSFIQRLAGKEWLVIRGTAFKSVSGFSIDFPVMGLDDYQAKIAASCKDT